LAISLIGSPYLVNGKDPKGFDCWGLVWYFYKQIGIETTDPIDYTFRKTSKTKSEAFDVALVSNNFVKIEKPQKNCIVSFSRNGYTVHVGIWLGKLEGCLHSCKNGVVCENIEKIKSQRCLSYEFYQWQELA
jgi:cell wall-associated NlpC family hydrolase